MVKIRTIQIRLTRDQYERIKNYSRIKGFNSLSGYLRYMGLDQDFILQQKISEMHNHLLGDLSGKPTKKFKTQKIE